MILDRVNRVYFAGIGGIGMSALAWYCLDRGLAISGYDKTPSRITEQLQDKGVPIHFEDEVSAIPKDVLNDSKTLVVYTPALPPDHRGLNYFRAKGYAILKRSDLLGEITKTHFTIAIAGTHGKTSTSGMVTHLLKQAGIDCYALVGGVLSNYQSNYIAARNKNCELFVVEADEFDKSFLKLEPNISVINSTEPDHLDIYGDSTKVAEGFQQFADKLVDQGSLCTFEETQIQAPEQTKRFIKYGFDKGSDVQATNVRIEDAHFVFDLTLKGQTIKDISMGVAGRHNIQNMLAAISAVSGLPEFDVTTIRNAAASFKGIKRRFEYIVRNQRHIYIDDYGHHPSELKATIGALKQLYPNKRITGIFQPHLYTRTRDFMDDFAQVLSALDEVLLLDIYPAREKPIDGITSEELLKKVNCAHKKHMTNEALLNYISESKPELLCTLGAGDIDRLVDPIKKILEGHE